MFLCCCAGSYGIIIQNDAFERRFEFFVRGVYWQIIIGIGFVNVGRGRFRQNRSASLFVRIPTGLELLENIFRMGCTAISD